MNKTTSFLLILASAFLIILIYVLSHINNFGPKDVLGLKTTTRITLLGDVMLGRSVMVTSMKQNDFDYPFKKVSSYLRGSDIVFANLESPFAEDCPQTNSGMIFCADPILAKGIINAGINVVTLANNHTGNYGKEGMVTTQKVLTENAIEYTGEGNLVIKEVNGIKFGFLGFNLMYRSPDNLEKKMIAESDKLVDVLIVGVHWGDEYQPSANNKQRAYARELVGLGADIIAGHHPHWVQDMETINGKKVYYSLGNFVFDQMWSEETRKGIAITLEFDGSDIVSEKITNIYINKLGQPEIVSR